MVQYLLAQASSRREVYVKVIAIVGLLFFGYCGVNVIAKRQYYSGVHLTIWLVIIGLGGWWCISTLFR